MMFRSYQDMVRTPKEPEKPTTVEVYHCDLCEKGGWHSENDVEIHKKNSHCKFINEHRTKYKDRFCTVCMKLLCSNEELIRHIKSQHLLSSPTAQRVEQKIYICNNCMLIFFNKDVLTAHILYVHETKRDDRKNFKFTCPKCFMRLSLCSIWFHFQKHNIPSVSLCDICLADFPNRKKLLEHIDSHKRHYLCNLCGYNSTKEHLFEAHLQIHTRKPVPLGKVSSGTIYSVFKKHKNTNILRYNIHNAVKGLNLPRFMEICTLCRQICLSKEEVVKHILRDHTDEGTEKRTHMCTCGEEFNYKIVLKQHVLKMKGSHKPLDQTNDELGTQSPDMQPDENPLRSQELKNGDKSPSKEEFKGKVENLNSNEAADNTLKSTPGQAWYLPPELTKID